MSKLETLENLAKVLEIQIEDIYDRIRDVRVEQVELKRQLKHLMKDIEIMKLKKGVD